MSTQADEPTERPDEPDRGEGGPGVEIGHTEGEGSTFEPEEDPEGHVD